MTPDIALILTVDGLANGAIYLLAGLGLVLIFSVTRVVFVPFGDIAAFTALTLAAFQMQRVPGTIGLVAVLAAVASLMELGAAVRRRSADGLAQRLFGYGLLPLIPCGLAWLIAARDVPEIVRIPVALGLALPMGPLLDRIAFRPIADASVLVLLIVAIALHFAIAGLGLLFFGPEGFRTTALVDGIFELPGGLVITGQLILMMASAVLLAVLFFLFFERSLIGKALRATAVNRTGARLVGIRPERTGVTAYLIASALAGISGILIGPSTTIYYDSGFLIGLKAFVGAIIGGLVSYPVTALGALFVGVMESFASFFSSAMKEVVVFSLLIPVLLWRSLALAHGGDEEHEELDG
ncbi:branched-chain amino acid ABC transporter permease [Prosthecomicrobium hirschii]|uniref:ABC transporter permease n=1 Tax=Prosthecodimorpha hirschii TaxID=665126 RepID=A0A0P6W8V3_9HYPH|nr:branched-chain amino acid ABC transporter permease [Prosthecomicrobium hirschii]KPL55589.1 ABC transporter permease [Prosthecomicrobium hirschii]MCW1839341.1 branched-chain amino acid ABC transporter permease [Prosthecomicrobium hirschii]TPQ50544.1 branched-chain amino acid ABC transporter permease [Prosthecomicrobium hirschii]